MAIDSRNKRASVIGHALPAVQALPAPDNTVADVDRKAMAWVYAAVLVAGPILVSGDHALPPFTQAATAEIEIHASGAHTLPAFTQDASGKVSIEVSGAHTLPAFTQEGTAVTGIAASGAHTLPAFTQSGTAEIEVHASGAHTLPAFTQTASATIEGFVSKIGDGDGTSGGNYQRPSRIFPSPVRKKPKKAPEPVVEEDVPGFEEILEALRETTTPLSESPDLVSQIIARVEPLARAGESVQQGIVQAPAQEPAQNTEILLDLGNRIFLELQKIREDLNQEFQRRDTRAQEGRAQLAEILKTADRDRVIVALESIEESDLQDRAQLTSLLLALAAA